ncbi:coniferyl alcohol acyltransferase-like [Diospyros lotus]|uniref:coniferyl alcohol acyltransferase-like n=1 Tax=Diospyros lotus TaxID=55363 RepID=UPI00225488F8|nr:coniferyl alcohol acyltransferase-like [Diospyros lotus]
MVGQKGGFEVKVRKEVVVAAAALPMQEHWLPQSNLDLLLPPVDVGVFFCYKKPAAAFGWMVSVLKKALAQVLVSYYAFSGEIVINSGGEPELICNNRGVDFTEAFADVRLEDINFYNPDESIEAKLVPKKKHGVLSVQATELQCGGAVVACSFDHRVADAYSANMFLVSWAEMAQSKPLSLLPSFRRSILSPRRPAGTYHPSIDEMYVPISALPPPKQRRPDSELLISRIYYVESGQLNHLQSLASDSCAGKKRTKLEAFSAFLWKIVAGRETQPDGTCSMGIVVDGRTRLSTIEGYFGNVLSIPFGKKSAGELRGKDLSWVANAVHEFLEEAVSKEHFLDLIDWVEAHRPEPGLSRIYAAGGGPAFVVSSGQRFPVGKVDFGWGRPALGSYHFPWGGDAGYVMPMPSPAGNGDWLVYMHLLEGQLETVEAQAGHVFKPLTFEYLSH